MLLFLVLKSSLSVLQTHFVIQELKNFHICASYLCTVSFFLSFYACLPLSPHSGPKITLQRSIGQEIKRGSLHIFFSLVKCIVFMECRFHLTSNSKETAQTPYWNPILTGTLKLASSHCHLTISIPLSNTGPGNSASVSEHSSGMALWAVEIRRSCTFPAFPS